MSAELKWKQLRPSVIGAEGYEITDMSAGNEQGWRGSFPGEFTYRWFGTMGEAQSAAQAHHAVYYAVQPPAGEVEIEQYQQQRDTNWQSEDPTAYPDWPASEGVTEAMVQRGVKAIEFLTPYLGRKSRRAIVSAALEAALGDSK